MLKGTLYRLAAWLALFGAAAAASVWLSVSERYFWLMATAGGLLFAGRQIFRLFYENIRKTTFMFNAIANGDYTFRFTEYDGSLADNALNRTLNRIKGILMREKEEIVRKEQYYSLILDSASTGILVTDPNGSILRSNNEAQRQLRLPVLTHLNQLARIDESLPGAFREMQADDRRRIRFNDERGEVTLSVRCSSIRSKESELRIFALNEIGSELVEQELESWVRLIRVLTHEIMNSITPITSLSETLMDTEGVSGEVRKGLETIHTTGKGLTAFVDSYRKLTRLPTPRPALIRVKPLLERIVSLTGQEFPDTKIALRTEPDDLILYADENLLFQVVTNLLKNAAQALDGQRNRHITLSTECPAGEQVTIRITDNGPGISPEILPHIFIPFFTTKEAGSGIGLSLSRQIMRLHGGSLTVRSQPGETTFSLLFP
ncbi:MAG: HAMP domain-containing histidine kinase [Culturomica sp.]|nr:HAMP domain-containing histidine kinase [Culturomica sp.]